MILGKTSVPEMMLWPFTETIAFGATHNPWDLDLHPGRQQRRQRGGGRCRARADGAGFRRCRLDPHPVDLVRVVRDQAAARPGPDGSARRRLVRVECQRARSPARSRTPRCSSTSPTPGAPPVAVSSAAAARKPKRLRIALSAKIPATIGGAGSAGPSRRRSTAVEALLRELGHEVFWRDPDYPAWAVYGHVLPRMWRGVYDDVQHLPHPERLEPRTRAIARLGSLISDRADGQDPRRRGDADGAGAARSSTTSTC